MPNYNNAKIYKLVNTVDAEIYVGSTCGTLKLRKSGHKSMSVRKPNRRVYEHLNRVGWNNVRIILIESFSCNNKDELLRREQHFIDELNPSLNIYSSIYSNCSHGRNRNMCRDCGGVRLCPHNIQKSKCKLCNGSGICEHHINKSFCVPCGGSQSCSHSSQKIHCKICNAGKYVCDFCNTEYGGRFHLQRHYTSVKHKNNYIKTFEEVFGEKITMQEATEMDFM
tara:strand:+ start:176 stop:847 length:672 start_codon:yes stop_codon:yes gene_type:complete